MYSACRHSILKKLLAILLVIVLTFGFCPISAFAEISSEDTGNQENATEKIIDSQELNSAEQEHNSNTSNESNDLTIVENNQTSIVGESEGNAEDIVSNNPVDLESDEATLSGTAHIQRTGWTDSVANTDTGIVTLGTEGKSLRVEAVTLKIDSNLSGSINYSTQIQNIGWQDFVADGEISGTEGQQYRLEAIKIDLTEDLADVYDIYYRVHAQNIGWMSWAKNGEAAGTEGYRYRLEAIQVILVKKGEAAPSVSSKVAYSFLSKANGPTGGESGDLLYNVHVQNIGWQSWKTSGELAGTSGQSLRLEGLHIKTAIEGLNINYATHVQNIGWQKEVSNGEMAGTSGQSLRLEAVKISLSGEEAENYDIYYRVHVQNIGWMAYAKNGEQAGSAGFGYRLEGIQIYLVKKGEDPNLDTSNQKSSHAFTNITGDDLVNASAHVSNIGWMNYVGQNETAGTTGQNQSLEAFKLNTTIENSGITYQSHVSNIGWQDWVSDSAVSGTTGQSKCIEAIKINLTGEAAEKYDIYYRAHVSYYGWMGWAKNGEAAGTVGCSGNVEAFQIVLVEKGSAAPGETANSYIEMPTISSSAYIETSGWQNASGGKKLTIGTTGKGLSIDALEASISSNISGGIQYGAYINSAGWQTGQSDGAIVGSEASGKQIEGVYFKLTGDLADTFDIYYRAHCSSYGWMGWTKNGSYAGTSTAGYGLQAVEIRLVLKGQPGPGTGGMSYSTFKLSDYGSYDQMVARTYSYESSTQYLIMIYKARFQLGVFQKTDYGWLPVKLLVCTIGKPSTPTPSSVSTVVGRHYYAGSSYYRTDCLGGYFAIHSVLHSDAELGCAISGSCVRVNQGEAIWIYNVIGGGAIGTTVVVY